MATAGVVLLTFAGLASVPRAGSSAPETTRSAGPAPIDFNREIRPILSDNCFKCHGPDSAARKAGLRLDRFEDATAALRRGGQAIVPGDSASSVLLARLTSRDPDFHMPPSEEGHQPSVGEIERLRRWIDEGAEWRPHWAFIAPERPAEPAVADEEWLRNPIDAFILARLESEGLTTSPEAMRTTLLRRVTLDLTGLPPTLDEIDAFLADETPDAYDKVVDRLLGSPRYGEHMTRYWLDAARFGDTHGLHLDNRRSMWRWRDWVIDAYNDNMPFDQFTIEQLAGDLLPEPTIDQQIATGFNRNNVTTSEGGAIDAEYLVKYAVDRVETTSTVWMGLTAGCAVCHDHKFDPISQKEFYQLFAFFNNVSEKAMDGNRHDPPPIVRAPTPDQETELASMQAETAALEQRIDAPMPEIDTSQTVWETGWRSRSAERWQVLDADEYVSTGGATLRKLEDLSLLAEGHNPERDHYVISARVPEGDAALRLVRIEALTHESLPHTGPGRGDNANLVLSEVEGETVSIADPENRRAIRFVTAVADHEQTNGPYRATTTIDGILDDTNGWAVEGMTRREDRTLMLVADEPFDFPGGTELRFRLKFDSKWARHAIGRVRISVSGDDELYAALAPSAMSPWHAVGPFPAKNGDEAYETAYGPERDPGVVDLDATYGEETLAWVEHAEFADGTAHTLPGEIAATYVYRTIDAPTGRSVELSLGSDDSIKVWVNGHLALESNAKRPVAPDQEKLVIDLDAGTNQILAKIVNYGGQYGFYFRPVTDGADAEFLGVLAMLTADPDSLDDEQRRQLRRFYRRRESPALKSLYDELRTREKATAAYEGTIPISLVMQEREDRRMAYVLRRGNYDEPLDEVMPGVPAALPPLPPMPDGEPATRLTLARWLVDGNHPLTARVAVNRLWQQHMGVGLVLTAEDFGSQGEWPSHPDLLDWLATEFVASEWDVKHLQRLIVASATYRQSARVTPDRLAHDSRNRLYARGPRFRMDAEMIRDQALAVSGLLVEDIGGPSVRPYQPPGVWKDVAYPDSDTQVFMQDEGGALYRRSMYTFWKRTSPPPSMLMFDAPSRETCVVRRPRTNTPLQSLVLLNDPQFVEASRAFAQRILEEASSRPEDRITMAFRLVTGRRPEPGEMDVLLDAYKTQVDTYRGNPAAAALLIDVGDSDAEIALDAREIAAWMNVVSIILNLDEALTKG